MNRWSRPVIILGGAVLFVAIACALYYRELVVYHGYTPLSFSREVWTEADAEHRGYMLKDLLNKRLLDGKTADEVRDLLGQPDAGSESGLLRYQIGYLGFNPRAPMVFSHTLFIDLDANGRVGNVYTGD